MLQRMFDNGRLALRLCLTYSFSHHCQSSQRVIICKIRNGKETTGNTEESLSEAEANPELLPSETPDSLLSIAASNLLVQSFAFMFFISEYWFFLSKLCNTYCHAISCTVR